MAAARSPCAGEALFDRADACGVCPALPFTPAALFESGLESHRGASMKCVLFYHAFTSCWNNGNAHFLRGIARELNKLGHEVVVYEPADGWSRVNAIRDGGEQTFSEVRRLFPHVKVKQYEGSLDLDEALDGADLV